MGTEQQYKRIMISQNQLLLLFRKPWFMEEKDVYCFTVTHIEGLPENYNVVAVDYNFEYASWSLIIESKEFDPIPMGEPVPVLKWVEKIVQKTEQYKKVESYVPLF